jgi:hypothetical protein
MPSRKPPAAAAVLVLFFATLNHSAPAAIFSPGEFVTYSQESWGDTPIPGNAAQLLAARFDFVYPAGIEVGVPGLSGFSMLFTSADGLLDYLPASGANGPLNNDLVDPTSSASGELGGKVVALQLNVDFNDAGDLTGSSSILFGDLILHSLPLSEFNGLAVREFLTEANSILGAVTAVSSYDAISFLLEDLTSAFEGGMPSQFAEDHLRIASAPGVVPELATVFVWGGLTLLAMPWRVHCKGRIRTSGSNNSRVP